MDFGRAQRFGRAGYRPNYIPPNTRQAMDGRLHPPGMSTSSTNSSWTFSNSHDLPKPRKGRLCGMFLIGAVLIVALSVIAIGGLAFYIGGYSMEKHQVNEYQTKESIGAKRQYSTMEQAKKSPSMQSGKISSGVTSSTSTTTTMTTTTEEIQELTPVESKKIPQGAILGISKTMQQLNRGIQNRKSGEEEEEEKEEEDEEDEIEETEADESQDLPPEAYEPSTESVSGTEEPFRSVVITKDVEILPKNMQKNGGNGEVMVIDVGEDDELRKEEGFSDRIGDENVEYAQIGHARPNYSLTHTSSSTPMTSHTPSTTTNKSPPLLNLFPPQRDYSDEPWRPIIPSYRNPGIIRSPYHEKYPEKVFERRYGPPIIPFVHVENVDDEIEHDVEGPITFSQESFNKNLRITPEYAGGESTAFHQPPEKNFSISSEIAAKFKEVIQPKMGTAEIASDEIITAPPAQSSDIIIVSDSKIVSAPAFIPRPDTVSTPKAVETEEVTTTRDYIKPTAQENQTNSTSTSSILSSITTVSPSSTTASFPTTTFVKTTTKVDVKTTPKAATIKAVLKIAGLGNPIHHLTEPTVSSTTTKTSPVVTTPSTTTTANLIDIHSMTSSASPKQETKTQPNITVTNPFLDDSRSSSSTFNFGLPDLPIIKQFHNLDNLFKSLSKPTSTDMGAINQLPKYFPRGEFENGTSITRFPVRTKPTTAKSYRNDGESLYVEISTIKPERATKRVTTRKSTVVRGDASVVSGSLKENSTPTTEIPRLITLLPVRSNLNMMRPLRPRPRPNPQPGSTGRNPKMNDDFKIDSSVSDNLTSRRHHFVQDKSGKVWVYYPSYRPTVSVASPNGHDEKLHIVTPQPKIVTDGNVIPDEKKFSPSADEYAQGGTVSNGTGNLSETVPETSLATKPKRNTSEIVDKIVKIMENIAIATDDSPKAIVKVNQTVMNKTTSE